MQLQEIPRCQFSVLADVEDSATASKSPCRKMKPAMNALQNATSSELGMLKTVTIDCLNSAKIVICTTQHRIPLPKKRVFPTLIRRELDLGFSHRGCHTLIVSHIPPSCKRQLHSSTPMYPLHVPAHHAARCPTRSNSCATHARSPRQLGHLACDMRGADLRSETKLER